MDFISGETVLLESEGQVKLVLTTHRVRLERRQMGQGEITSIMLDELASCAIVKTSRPLLLVLAVIAIVAGIAGSDRESSAALLGIVIGLGFGFFYLIGRRQVLALASAGATIRVNTQGMRFEAVEEMVDATEKAKHDRYMLLS